MATLPPELKAWRRSERERLIAARAALSPAVLEAWRQRIDRFLELSFPGLARFRLAFCWPIKGEYDARHFARTMRDRQRCQRTPVAHRSGKMAGVGPPLHPPTKNEAAQGQSREIELETSVEPSAHE